MRGDEGRNHVILFGDAGAALLHIAPKSNFGAGMIKSFKSREAEKIFSRQRSGRVPEEIQRAALRELRALDRALAVQESWLRSVNGSPEHAGRYAIALDDRWRIYFEWRDGQVYDVDVVDEEKPAPHL